MIYVDRGSVSEPAVFRSKRMARLREEARRQFSAPGEKDPGRIKFDTRFYPKVRVALRRLFHGKCAYCESRLDHDYGDVELFRPKRRAMNLDGRISEGYWWLAYEWGNFYVSCQICNRRYKRNRFPVKGRRAESKDDLPKEKALLIDPCRKADFEEEHFGFFYDDKLGTVDIVGRTEKGKISVDILGLNRDELRLARGSVWSGCLSLMRVAQVTGSAAASRVLRKQLDAALEPNQPYIAMKRHMQMAYAAEHVEQIPGVLSELRAEIQEARQPIFTESRARDLHAKKMAEQVDYSVLGETKLHKQRYFVALKEIERLEIENFRVIRKLELDFRQTSGHEEASWLTLIGENASGKSTVLKAIALTLMGHDERKKLDLQAADYITHGAPQAQVRVHLTNVDRPIMLTITRKPTRFECNVRDPLVLILGYGSTRLLRRWRDPLEKKPRLVRIGNLFDPYQKLNHVEKWLGDTSAVSTGRFKSIRNELLKLLLLDPERDRIYRRKGRVYVTMNGEHFHLEEMSDGYQSVVALALDIMMVLTEKWQSIGDAEGIVLIDELGVHLHPRWKMQISEKLKKTFPGLQFIATTHEPLCLRGLTQGQVVLLRRNENLGGVEAVTDLPSPADYRVDQLLTSTFFGLHSALDWDTERLFSAYYQLLAERNPSATQQERLKKLKETLKGRRHLGSTLREEIMYEVIDKLLAEKKHDKPELSINEIKKRAEARIAELWSERLPAHQRRSRR